MTLWLRKLLRDMTRPETVSLAPRIVLVTDSLPLNEWRKTPANVSEARAFYNSEYGRSQIAVLRAEAPYAHEKESVPALIEYGIHIGYERAIGTLLAMQEYGQELPEQVEADFGAEEILRRDGLMTDDGKLK